MSACSTKHSTSSDDERQSTSRNGALREVQPASSALDERRAVGEVVRVYLPLVRGLVALNVPAIDLEDVLQDCIVAVILSLANLRDARAEKSWVIAVTFKVIAKYHRSQRVRRQWLVQGVEIEDSPALSGSPEQHVEIARLGVLLGAMEPELREVLLSRRADGLPMREVARDAGISLATVKRRLTRAREALEAWREGPADTTSAQKPAVRERPL